jgi:hypothetical protein
MERRLRAELESLLEVLGPPHGRIRSHGNTINRPKTTPGRSSTMRLSQPMQHLLETQPHVGVRPLAREDRGALRVHARPRI